MCFERAGEDVALEAVDHFLLRGLEIIVRIPPCDSGSCRATVSGDFPRQVFRTDDARPAEDRSALDGVSKLAYVSTPRMSGERARRFR